MSLSTCAECQKSLTHISNVNLYFGGEATWELVSVGCPCRADAQVCCSARWWFIRSCVLCVWCEAWEEQGGCLFPSTARLRVWLHPFIILSCLRVPGKQSDTRVKCDGRICRLLFCSCFFKLCSCSLKRGIVFILALEVFKSLYGRVGGNNLTIKCTHDNTPKKLQLQK